MIYLNTNPNNNFTNFIIEFRAFFEIEKIYNYSKFLLFDCLRILTDNENFLLATIATASFCDEARRAKDIVESGKGFRKKRKSYCS